MAKYAGSHRKKSKTHDPFFAEPLNQPTISSSITMTTNYIITCHCYNEYLLTAMVINCKCLLTVTLVMMSETDAFDLHAVRHHQPSGCGKESSELSEYHQSKHFERRSHGSRRLIAFLFSSAATMARPGVVIDMQA